MQSVRFSLPSVLDAPSPIEKSVTKHTRQFRQQLSRLWRNSDDGVTDMPRHATVEDLLAIILSPAMQGSWFPLMQKGLTSLDSSACAALLKELGRKGHSCEAFEIFDWLRSLDASHELEQLLDVYTYTTMIAQCATTDRAGKAAELIREMRQRGIPCNVHTYSALLHVYAKTDQTELALGIPELMKADGCLPNIVTFNTLINLFRKLGEWKKAVEVIDIIDRMKINAEAKTYNAVISACSSCGEPAQALYVYHRMLAKDVQPSAATYTALISAHGKKGLVQEALAIFHDMVQRGCARNVITYSSLIGACEKTGQWKLAIDLFNKMKSEGIQPNIITFNSLMTACSTSKEWTKAYDVYGYMVRDGCRPDQTTYTTLLGALMRGGGQWTVAIGILEDMTRASSCRPDTAVYNAIVDILWSSGEKTAQTTALHVWKFAQQAGNIRFGVRGQGTEYSVEVFTCGAAVITVLMWLVQLKSYTAGVQDATLVMKCGRRSALEQDQREIRDAVTGVLSGLNAPFVVSEVEQSVRVTYAVGEMERTEWFRGSDCEGMIRAMDEAMSVPPLTSALLLETTRIRAKRCYAAYESVLNFEAVDKACRSNPSTGLLLDRSSIARSALSYAAGLGLDKDMALDAVWLFDRIVASGEFDHRYLTGHVNIFIYVSLLLMESTVKARSSSPISPGSEFHPEDLISVTAQVHKALKNDLRGVSPMRILRLFGELLGNCSPFGLFLQDENGFFRSVITHLVRHPASLQVPSSQLACCILYEARRVRQIYPYWPTEVARMTGYTSTVMEQMVNSHAVVTDIITQISNALSTEFVKRYVKV